MDEKQNKAQTPTPQKPTAVLFDDTVETSKEGVRAYLEDAATLISSKDDKKPWHGGAAHKVAVFRYLADIMKISGEARKQAYQHWMKTPAWFGCNASQGRQAYEQKTATEEKVAEYLDEV